MVKYLDHMVDKVKLKIYSEKLWVRNVHYFKFSFNLIDGKFNNGKLCIE